MRSTFDERVFQYKSVFGKVDVFLVFWEGGFGRFRIDFDEFVSMLAWNRDDKCW